MWRTAASLELLPIGTKTELGEALVKRVKAGDFKESELWCLSRLGARKLFYGPINLVVPPADGDPLGRGAAAAFRHAGDALASMARRTGDPTRDLSRRRRAMRTAKLQALPHADRLLAVLEGEEEETSARWAGSSARSCRPAWCSGRLLRRPASLKTKRPGHLVKAPRLRSTCGSLGGYNPQGWRSLLRQQPAVSQAGDFPAVTR